jgi:hypothetical protein
MIIRTKLVRRKRVKAAEPLKPKYETADGLIRPEQLKAARALLVWSPLKLAIESDVGKRVITDFEDHGRELRPATLDLLKRALEAAGVVFSSSGDPSAAPVDELQPQVASIRT